MIMKECRVQLRIRHSIKIVMHIQLQTLKLQSIYLLKNYRHPESRTLDNCYIQPAISYNA